jgi:hypothetical protein
MERKVAATPFSATVDANVNDYLKFKMHLLKTIQMVQQQRGFIGNFNAANYFN